MQNSSTKLLPKVLVIAHDAGGAEIIGAYILKHRERFDFHCYVAGPARIIFRRLKIPSRQISSDKKEISRVIKGHSDAKFILLGTGWMTRIEFDALIEAKNIGLKTVVYLESWVNYRERFLYPEKNWQKNLPDEIWVGDKYALVMAKKYFLNTEIKFVTNQYFLAITKRYRELRSLYKEDRGILFLSDVASGVELALETILIFLAEKKKPPSLRIRFHPADNLTRYDELIKKYGERVLIEKSKEKDIVRDLLRARVVIGTETVAMVGSVLSGITTISIATLGKKPQLPFRKIIRVRRAKDIASLI
jgi:hypothetical protein